MYRDPGLVAEAERYRTGANTHWLTGTLHVYFNTGSARYKHLFSTTRQDELETLLRKFVASKGVGRTLTEDEIAEVYKRLGWKAREGR